MSRILSNSDEIHSFQEIHFFESLFSANEINKLIEFSDALSLTNKLIAIQEQGFYKQKNINKYSNISKKMLTKIKSNYTPIKVYYNFLTEWAQFKGKSSACEQTPKNIYYLDIIDSSIPNAKFIHLLRDPRNVLLSQKFKWKRKFLGEPEMPFIESLRAWTLYHPITISKLWLSAIESFERFNSENIINIKFEDLMNQPKEEIKRVCDFSKIPFTKNLLNVPVVGSSVSKDSTSETGIKKKVTSDWKNSNISNTEIFLLQIMLKNKLKKYGYKKSEILPNFFYLSYLILIFPIKILLATILNLSRMKSITDTLKRRL